MGCVSGCQVWLRVSSRPLPYFSIVLAKTVNHELTALHYIYSKWTFKVLAYVGHRTFEVDDYQGII